MEFYQYRKSKVIFQVVFPAILFLLNQAPAAAAALTPTKVRPVVKVAAKTGVASVGRCLPPPLTPPWTNKGKFWCKHGREREKGREKESGKLLQS